MPRKRPRFNFGNDHADHGLWTRCVPLSTSTNQQKPDMPEVYIGGVLLILLIGARGLRLPVNETANSTPGSVGLTGNTGGNSGTSKSIDQ
ncbi:unnamed protein product, partial [Protopolystoma xenopodis]